MHYYYHSKYLGFVVVLYVLVVIYSCIILHTAYSIACGVNWFVATRKSLVSIVCVCAEFSVYFSVKCTVYLPVLPRPSLRPKLNFKKFRQQQLRYFVKCIVYHEWLHRGNRTSLLWLSHMIRLGKLTLRNPQPCIAVYSMYTHMHTAL